MSEIGMPEGELEVLEEVLQLVASGMSIKRAAEQVDGIDRNWVTYRLAKHEPLRARFNEAKATGCMVQYDEIEDMWDDIDRELRAKSLNPKIAVALVRARRHRIDDRKWGLAKMLPKLFGVTAGIAPGTPVTFQMNLGSYGEKAGE